METTDWPRGAVVWAHRNPAVAQVRMGVKEVPAESRAQQQTWAMSCHQRPSWQKEKEAPVYILFSWILGWIFSVADFLSELCKWAEVVWDEKREALRPDGPIIQAIEGSQWFWIGRGTQSSTGRGQPRGPVRGKICTMLHTSSVSAVKPQGKESCWMGKDAKKECCLEGFSEHFCIKEEQLEGRRWPVGLTELRSVIRITLSTLPTICRKDLREPLDVGFR